MAAFRKTISPRFSQIAQTAASPRRFSDFRSLMTGSPDPAPGPFRRSVTSFLQKRPVFQPALPPGPLVERLRYLDPDRIRLELLLPAAPDPAPNLAADDDDGGPTGSAARKRERAALARLRAAGRRCIAHAEFLQICGGDVARSLDESGAVIVWGDVVLLRPEEVAREIERTINSQILPPWSDAQNKELRELESAKAEIDSRAAANVKRELQCGLALLAAQTAEAMRITFWDLTWDVMEPICFFATYIYFMVGYLFFMRTSTEPSFKGFSKSRYAAWQRRLTRAGKFDVERFNELRRACPNPAAPRPVYWESASSSPSHRHL